MEFRFEEFTAFDPSLSAEELAEAKAAMLKFVAGAKQQWIGDKRREMAETFFNLLEPARKKKLDEEISALHITKDEARFRVYGKGVLKSAKDETGTESG